jgi:hypothetical protein
LVANRPETVFVGLVGLPRSLVSTFNLCADVLRRELDIQPSPLIRYLYLRLIQMDGDLDLTFALPEAILRAQPLPVLNKIWMNELSRLLPEILADHANLTPPGPLQESWQIHRLHEALSRAFVAQTPYLLLIRNLQWSDPQSLCWLVFLQRFAPDHPHLIVASLSHDKPDANPLLSSLLDTLEAGDHLTRIPIPEKNS